MNNNLGQAVPEIIINDKSFRIHPVYDLYGSSEDGFVTNIVRQKPILGGKRFSGYLCVTVKNHIGEKKMYASHRFIWECYNGVIQDDKVIGHINNKKDDNRLRNLRLITKQQSYLSNAKKLRVRKYVRAVNCNDGEESFYNSMYAVNQHLGINVGIVKMACEGLNNCKSGISKKDGCRYKFNYISKEELPEDHKKSANIRKKKEKG